MLIGSFAFAHSIENSYFQKEYKTFQLNLNETDNLKLVSHDLLVDLDCLKLSQEVGSFLEKNTSISQWRIDLVVEIVKQVCEKVTR